MATLFEQARQIILIVLLAVGAVGGVIMLHGRGSGEPAALALPTAVPLLTPTVAPSPTAAPVVVFMSGAVVSPGVYELPPGSRIVDALRAAGGPTGEAAIESLNQATLLVDGMQIHMPTEGSAPTPPPIAAPTGAAPAPSTETDTGAGSALVHLNSASQVELESLPGIGPALAGRIIAYREANGPFATVEQLVEVSGIGDSTVEKLREFVVVP